MAPESQTCQQGALLDPGFRLLQTPEAQSSELRHWWLAGASNSTRGFPGGQSLQDQSLVGYVGLARLTLDASGK